jgi:hypothetical protein
MIWARRIEGALVSTDAMGCQVSIAQSTLDAGADYLLAVKGNQSTLHAEFERYFATAPPRGVRTPRALSPAAMARSDVAPPAGSSATMGQSAARMAHHEPVAVTICSLIIKR